MEIKLFPMALLAMDMTFVVLMSLKFSPISTARLLIQKISILVILLPLKLIFVLFRLIHLR